MKHLTIYQFHRIILIKVFWESHKKFEQKGKLKFYFFRLSRTRIFSYLNQNKRKIDRFVLQTSPVEKLNEKIEPYRFHQ